MADDAGCAWQGGTMSDELGTVVDSRNLYEATVATSEHLRRKPSLTGAFSLSARVLYDQAVRNGAVPKRASASRQAEYLRERREFVLVEKGSGKGGIGGLVRPSHDFIVLMSDVCVACGGEIIWKPVPLDSSTCDEKRVCAQCGASPALYRRRQPGRPHDFGEEVRVKDACKVRKTCAKCGYALVAVSHSYVSDGSPLDWHYERDGSCTQTRTCTACGNVETRVFHVGDWAPDGEGTCADGVHVDPIKRVCTRCGELERDSECWIGPS